MSRHVVVADLAASAETVWDRLLDPTEVAGASPLVEGGRVVGQRSDTDRSTAWSLLVLGGAMPWVQDEVIDPGDRTVTFRLRSGAPKVLLGSWTVTSTGPLTCRVAIELTFEFGLPGIGDHMSRGLVKALATVLEDLARRLAPGPDGRDAT